MEMVSEVKMTETMFERSAKFPKAFRALVSPW